MTPSTARPPTRKYEEYLDRIDLATLKRLSKFTGGPVNARRDDLTAWVKLMLSNPQNLQQAVKSLPSYESSTLAVLRELGGEAEERVLRAAVYAAGIQIPGTEEPEERFSRLLRRLMRTALVLKWTEYGSMTNIDNYSYSYAYHPNLIFSDDRILEGAGQIKYGEPEIKPFQPTMPVVRRIPHLITMQLVGLMQAIENSTGLNVTQAGDVRVVDLRKLAKQLNWPDGSLSENGLEFHNALAALITALRSMGVLELIKNRLEVSAAGRIFSRQPVEEQVEILFRGFSSVSNWAEDGERPSAVNNPYPAARAAFIFLLKSLPVTPGAFFTLNDIDKTLYDRISSFFTLKDAGYQSYYQRMWNPRRLTSVESYSIWAKRERQWIEKALTSWLYFLGLVELEMYNGHVRSFGLTPLGLSVLHPNSEVKPNVEAPVQEGPSWVIQPNFDIIAYLDRLTSVQLAFLERHADRRNAQEHLAEYRLTRDSIYRGLESGTKLDDLLAILQEGSGREVPQNIVTEVREWAAQRERITLYRRATLAEFPDDKARDLALRAGLRGTPHGDRYLLLPASPNRPLTRIFKQTINYMQTPQRNLLVGEDGSVTFNSPTPDILVTARLNAWTEPDAKGGRRFTRQSVQAAIGAGRSLPALLRILDDRQAKIIPSLVRLSLRAWAGEKFKIDLEPVVVLRVASPELNFAIQQSDLLRPYIVSTITPGIFMARPDRIDELQKLLEQMGFGPNGSGWKVNR